MLLHIFTPILCEIMEDLKDQFFAKLEEKYGSWERNSARFGTFSYGEIADELSISGSQFSKLLYGTATNGMYERTIKNIERLIEKDQLHQQNSHLSQEISQLKEQVERGAGRKAFPYFYMIPIALLLVLGGYFLSTLFREEASVNNPEEKKARHFLAEFFEQDFNSPHISPFLSSGEAQSYCPCSAFEGTWALDKEYVIPIPMGKPGLYYRAKRVDMKMKCYRNVPSEQKGLVLLGFEEMEHELWLDTNREPISPKYFDFRTKQYTKAFFEIDFEGASSFQKIATINSFMFDVFELKGQQILRKAEPVGRYAKEIDYELCRQYEIDVEDIMDNIIGNLIKTVCQPAVNQYCNPNALVENESTITFDCNFTIAYENLGIGGSYPYAKAFRLVEQNYSDNLLCNCND